MPGSDTERPTLPRVRNPWYDELFQDEGHLLFLFLEYESSVYKEYLYLGSQVSSVIDREAQEILIAKYSSPDVDDDLAELKRQMGVE